MRENMQRETNFVEFPGTGIWVIVDSKKNVSFYQVTEKDQYKYLQLFIIQGNDVYWCDMGMGLMNFAQVVHTGKKSQSCTKITVDMLKKYGAI